MKNRKECGSCLQVLPEYFGFPSPRSHFRSSRPPFSKFWDSGPWSYFNILGVWVLEPGSWALFFWCVFWQYIKIKRNHIRYLKEYIFGFNCNPEFWLWKYNFTCLDKIKGYLRYKTILCYKVALDL